MSINEPQSRFRQLADLLREKINSGEYPRGTRMPSEPDLAARYGVSQVTANRAMGILRSEGLVRVERGKGTVVHEIPPLRRAATSRYSRVERERGEARGAFAAEIKALGYNPRSDLVECGWAAAPARVAEALGLPQGEPNVLIRKRHMFANDIPVQLATSYIPRTIAEGTQLAEKDTGPGGSKSRLVELGYAQVRITESISVRRPTAEEQSFLRLTEDQSLIEILHVGWTADGQPVEVCVHSMPTHQWILDYEWRTEESDM